jgi:hypothetical protein
MSDSRTRHVGDVPAVSVVIPALNAERTLAATLESVLSQSFDDFEAILIDDGSTDATPSIARSFAARDPRLRILTQENSGVADARNAGIRAARAALVSPIDSDDVWHPTFLEKLHGALAAASDDTLFAFANFRNIDMEGQVLGSAPHHPVGGRVFHRFMLKNFVGNGSGMMFRRDAALAVGGYERRLQHEFGAQGCEDWLLQMRLARIGDAVGVCEYLVGYRDVPGAMSSDQVRMWRSRIHAFEILFDEFGCEETTPARWGLGRARAQCMVRELLAGQVVAALRSLQIAVTRDPVGTLDLMFEGVTRAARRSASLLLLRPWRRTKGPFASCDPLEQRRPLGGGLLARRLSQMAELDLEPLPLPKVLPPSALEEERPDGQRLRGEKPGRRETGPGRGGADPEHAVRVRTG